jgi:hypothetical protein
MSTQTAEQPRLVLLRKHSLCSLCQHRIFEETRAVRIGESDYHVGCYAFWRREHGKAT